MESIKTKNILGLLELEKFIDDIEGYYNLYANPSIENQINLEKLVNRGKLLKIL